MPLSTFSAGISCAIPVCKIAYALTYSHSWFHHACDNILHFPENVLINLWFETISFLFCKYNMRDMLNFTCVQLAVLSSISVLLKLLTNYVRRFQD